MKKTITLICLAFMAVCLTNAQEIIRTLKTNDWEKKLETDVTYTIEPFGDKVTIKEGDTFLHSLTLPETLIFNTDGVLINGVRWATRNLASHGKFVEKPEDYGSLFQWGRKGDGHERRNSPKYPTDDYSYENGKVSGEGLDENGQIVSAHPAYGKFIKDDSNWRSPDINTLWNSGTESFPIKTANDPCPAGWRVPTHAEVLSLIDSGSEWDELNGVSGRYFGTVPNQIFLPAAGGRISYGEVLYSGLDGAYWQSTFVNTCVPVFDFDNESMLFYCCSRASGFSIRCVAE